MEWNHINKWLRPDSDLLLSDTDTYKPDISEQASTQATAMGIIRSTFSFIAGTVFGVYLAQNYQIPNIRKLADTALLQAKQVEEKYRKSKKKGGDDD